MKIKLSLSLHKKSLDAISELIEDGTFRNRSHAVEFAIRHLDEQEFGGERHGS
ncbi:hypothetical protein HYV84_07730 [Candidatus Woesearchaeota archaeon]|nr:hypothetical protein [Candidatus Woesearchaeota archaeon]